MTSYVEVTQSLWRHKRSNSPGWKKKGGKHSSSKTRLLRCSSSQCSWCCQLKTSAAPQSQRLRESNCISASHVSSHLPWINMQSVSSEARELWRWNSFCRCTMFSRGGEEGVTFNECSKVVEWCWSNVKPQRCSFPSSAHFQCLRVTSLAITDRCPEDCFLTCRAYLPVADNPR